MNVTVFGIGYVGLVQAAVLADVGNTLMCVDIDPKKITALKHGNIPIYEPGLENLVKENIKEDRLLFTTDAKEGISHSDLFFIAVGTPPDEDGSADIQYVLAVAATIAEHIEGDAIVVTKSTVPVGTADKVLAKISEVLESRGASYKVSVVSNPEFLKEGAAVADCQQPDRIVIGTDDLASETKLRELYAPFNRKHDRIICMDVRSAELTKYAANCMLATKISFMNELANLAERMGADIEQVRHGIGSDSRIGYSFIYPGCGYGGSCFPKDVQALARSANQVGYPAELLQAVESVNYRQKEVMFNLLEKHFHGDLQSKTIAIWGLSFKPNTDDMREASSRVLMERLWAAGAKVQAFDPESMEEARRIYGDRNDLELAAHKEAALENADALAICTEWRQFKSPDFERIKSKLTQPTIIDGRNLYSPQEMQDKGINYYAIGRGKSLDLHRAI